MTRWIPAGVLSVLFFAVLADCGSSGARRSPDGSVSGGGGAIGSGGVVGSGGGAGASGGMTGSGGGAGSGSPGGGSGGAIPGTGGKGGSGGVTSATGGTTASAGATSTVGGATAGGSIATGGIAATGGLPSTGGAGGGTSGFGGSSSVAGGSATGGAAGTGGASRTGGATGGIAGGAGGAAGTGGGSRTGGATSTGGIIGGAGGSGGAGGGSSATGGTDGGSDSSDAGLCGGEYTACGCGCCGGYTPRQLCYYPALGETFDSIVAADIATKDSPNCADAGCRIGTQYVCCVAAPPEFPGSATYAATGTSTALDRIRVVKTDSSGMCTTLRLATLTTGDALSRITLPAYWGVEEAFRAPCVAGTPVENAMGGIGSASFHSSAGVCVLDLHVTLFFDTTTLEAVPLDATGLTIAGIVPNCR